MIGDGVAAIHGSSLMIARIQGTECTCERVPIAHPTPCHVAYDDDTIYWTSLGTESRDWEDGAVLRSRLSAWKPEFVLKDQDMIGGLVKGARGIYLWVLAESKLLHLDEHGARSVASIPVIREMWTSQYQSQPPFVAGGGRIAMVGWAGENMRGEEVFVFDEATGDIAKVSSHEAVSALSRPAFLNDALFYATFVVDEQRYPAQLWEVNLANGSTVSLVTEREIISMVVAHNRNAALLLGRIDGIEVLSPATPSPGALIRPPRPKKANPRAVVVTHGSQDILFLDDERNIEAILLPSSDFEP